MVSFDPRVSFSSASIVATPCFLRNAIITGVTNIRDLAIVERFERFASRSFHWCCFTGLSLCKAINLNVKIVDRRLAFKSTPTSSKKRRRFLLPRTFRAQSQTMLCFEYPVLGPFCYRVYLHTRPASAARRTIEMESGNFSVWRAQRSEIDVEGWIVDIAESSIVEYNKRYIVLE